MTTSKQLFQRFGPPDEENNMSSLVIPGNLGLHHVPGRIYCNKDMQPALLTAFKSIAALGLQDLIKTYDGCFCIRRKTGGSSPSLHSWGYAIDINAAWNRFGQSPTMDSRIVESFEDAGFEWGGRWKGSIDGMHFEYKL
jgi:hypothetical protein